MTPQTWEIIKWLVGGVGVTAITTYGVITSARRSAEVKAKADLAAKSILDKTQIEVTHIQDRAAFTDDLREELREQKSALHALQEKVDDWQQKWFDQREELFQAKTRIKELETQVSQMADGHRKSRQDCEEQIGKMHDEIVVLTNRCAAIEKERDEWKVRYEKAVTQIGSQE